YRAARIGDAINRFGELRHHFGFFRIAEIEAVRGRHRTRARASHVASRFGNRVHRAETRRKLAPAAVSVGRKRQRAIRSFDPHDRSISRAWCDARVRAHHVIILTEHPALRGNRWRSEQFAEIFCEINRCWRESHNIFRWRLWNLRRDWPFGYRRFIGNRVRGNVRDHAPALEHAQPGITCDAPDFYGVEAPFAENVEDFAFAPALGDEQHAFLRFAEHDFVRRHARFALRNAIQLDLDTHPAARSHFAGRAGEPRGAHILNRDDCTGAHRFEARFEQQFFHERIADLHIRALLLRLFVEFR